LWRRMYGRKLLSTMKLSIKKNSKEHSKPKKPKLYSNSNNRHQHHPTKCSQAFILHSKCKVEPHQLMEVYLRKSPNLLQGRILPFKNLNSTSSSNLQIFNYPNKICKCLLQVRGYLQLS
jgi:hypothetical protein